MYKRQDTNYLAHRNSAKSKRIVIPEIVFRSKSQFHNIVNAVDVIRSDSQFLHFLAVERSVMIYTLHSLFKTNALDFTKACQHGFTDVDTTVVYNICFDYLIAVCRYNVSQCVA